ncbi:hypothetical protein FBY35_5860 [Streptomyces sp. SLBN-118]|nr:hypothetical protein FBY35_5860 [Streptomyces sp. SLBN-118]
MNLRQEFKELDRVPWWSYGWADLPTVIRALTSPDPDYSDEAIEDLYDRVLNQETVLPATVPTVPFIARLAAAGVRPPRCCTCWAASLRPKARSISGPGQPMMQWLRNSRCFSPCWNTRTPRCGTLRSGRWPSAGARRRPGKRLHASWWACVPIPVEAHCATGGERPRSLSSVRLSAAQRFVVHVPKWSDWSTVPQHTPPGDVQGTVRGRKDLHGSDSTGKGCQRTTALTCKNFTD